LPKSGTYARERSGDVDSDRNMLGLKHECPQEREKLAYEAQDRWLHLFGHSLETDFELDGFPCSARRAGSISLAAGASLPRRRSASTILGVAPRQVGGSSAADGPAPAHRHRTMG
jgi:hypothetical protein